MKSLKSIRKLFRAINYDLFNKIEKNKIPSVEKVPKDRPVPTHIDNNLPSIEKLYEMFNSFNFQYFENKLPKVEIVYSTRMTNAGSYTPALKLIKISKKYHEIFPDDLEDTLKHEMIHIVHFYHNREFKEVATRIGASLKAKSHPALRRKTKYLYFCKNCKKEYPRQKILRMASCGSCSENGKYDSRYKLKLVKT